jgi:hypothetical protein
MSDMDVRHEEVVISNDGVITFACGTVDRHVFTQLDAIPHDYTGGLTFEFVVLRWATENNARFENTVLTNRYIFFEDDMCEELGIGTDGAVWADDAKGTDFDSIGDYRGLIHDGSRMYHSTHSAASRS